MGRKAKRRQKLRQMPAAEIRPLGETEFVKQMQQQGYQYAANNPPTAPEIPIERPEPEI